LLLTLEVFRWRIKKVTAVPALLDKLSDICKRAQKLEWRWLVRKKKVENMTRILLYSDEPILAKGLESVLRQVEGFELLPTCGTVAGLMEQLGQGTPDLVLMDLTPEITFAVLSEMKHAMTNSKIVLWVNSISTELAFQAMGLGVRGILRKTLPTDLQVKCLLKVQAGELWFEKALTDSFLCARRVALTQREGQLVSLLSQGLKNKEIATTLMISEGTVKVYLSRLFQKVGVKDRFELALFGLKNLTTGQLPVGEKGQRAGASSMPGLRSLVLERPMERADAPQRFATPLRPVASRHY
jgi:DNA-binding NarL/FixJ family response regulator